MIEVPMISIIDDDESVRSATASLVRSLGYETRVFESANGFLRHPFRDQTSCIITDIQMPEMTGIELQTRLIAEGVAIPMIFVTGFPDTAQERLARDRGAAGFFAKPFQAQQMIDCLEHALAG